MASNTSSTPLQEAKAPPPSFPVAIPSDDASTDSPSSKSPATKIARQKVKGARHPSHNFSLDDDSPSTSTPTADSSGEISSTRKKSVRFDGNETAAAVALASSPAAKDSPLGSRSGSQSMVPNSPRKSSGSLSGVSPRSVLKRSADAEDIKRFAKKMSKISLLLERLKKGDNLIKYYDNGVKHMRHFYVTDDGSELRWCKPLLKGLPKKIANDSKLVLAEVRGIVFGPRTERFEDYDWLKSQPYNCFSVVMEGRTLDIECKTREQFMVWFLGLQALCPLSHKFWNRGQLNWHRALYKTLQIAGNSGVDVSTVWHDLVNLSKKELAQRHEYERRRSNTTNATPTVASSHSHGSFSNSASTVPVQAGQHTPSPTAASTGNSGNSATLLSHLPGGADADSFGKVVIREHLAKQALSIIQTGPSTPTAGSPSSGGFAASMSSLEQKSDGNDSEEDDAAENDTVKRRKHNADLAVVSEPTLKPELLLGKFHSSTHHDSE